MIHQELLFYVKEQQKRGVPNATIKQVLMQEGGWIESDIDEVFRFVVAPPQPVVRTAPAEAPAFVPATPAVKSEQAISPAAPIPESLPKTTPVASPVVATAPLASPLVQSKQAEPLSPYAPTKAGSVPAFSGMETKVMLEKAKPTTHRGRMATIVIVILLLGLLGGGGTYAYTTYFSPAPETAFSRGYQAFAKTDSFRFSLEAAAENLSDSLFSFLPAETEQQIAIEPGADSATTSKFSLSGTVARDSARPRFAVTGSLLTPKLPVTVAFQARTDKENILVKFPNLGYFIERFNLPNETLPETWYYAGASDIQKAFAAPQFTTLRALTPVFAGGEGSTTSVFTAFTRAQIIVPTTVLPKASEGGKTYLRYQFTVNKDALKTVLLDLIKQGQGVDADASQNAEIDRMLEALTFSDGEFWLAPITFLPHKISFTVTANEGETMPFKNLSVALTLSGYGDALTNEVVPTPVPFSEVIANAVLTDKNLRVTSLISQSRVQAEMYYGKVRSYRNLCTRSTELATTFGEIKNITGTDPVCIATTKAYAIASPLPGDTAQVACVDSAGANGTIAALPTKTVCE